ncbi:hypothetical protein JCM17846_06710 [Iodidimonas nitroreducens]|uniref:Secreted protein n=1 Tax=Iodidimonas nitroreducens TaxID=1236968 RepID=A0A5A7N7D5_9PROT|nr:hypothetical protein JCM17846_06710 [Iodidimonas nitroreducens]
MKLARTIWLVLSSCKSLATRGVAALETVESVVTMIDREKVVTASIDVARIPSTRSTASAPKVAPIFWGIMGPKGTETKAVNTPSRA